MTGGLTTGIGSLPFTDVKEALEYSLSHDVPFLPELPRLDPEEFMIPAALRGLGSGVPDLSMLERFLGALKTPRSTNHPTSSPGALIKLQMAGPTTLAAFAPSVEREKVVPWLVLRARAMIAAARSRGHEVLFVLDEPGLVTHPAFGLDVLVREVHAAGAKAGLHCCGETDWGALRSLGLEALSFDARFVGDGVGRLIVGTLVPVTAPPGSWWSTPCGLGLETPAEAWRRLDLVRACARAGVRGRAFSE